jgi:hypothetical protein
MGSAPLLLRVSVVGVLLRAAPSLIYLSETQIFAVNHNTIKVVRSLLKKLL